MQFTRVALIPAAPAAVLDICTEIFCITDVTEDPMKFIAPHMVSSRPVTDKDVLFLRNIACSVLLAIDRPEDDILKDYTLKPRTASDLAVLESLNKVDLYKITGQERPTGAPGVHSSPAERWWHRPSKRPIRRRP